MGSMRQDVPRPGTQTPTWAPADAATVIGRLPDLTIRLGRSSTDHLFEGLVVSNPPRLRPRGRWGMATAIVGHAIGTAAVIVVPILISNDLPDSEQRVKAFLVEPPVPTPPPPPPPVRDTVGVRPASPTIPARPRRPDEFVAPIEIPDLIPEPPPVLITSDTVVSTGEEVEMVSDSKSGFKRIEWEPDVKAQAIDKPEPTLPKEAYRLPSQTIEVFVWALIVENGTVQSADPEDAGLEAFTEAVREAFKAAAKENVEKWRFVPGRKGATKVVTYPRLTVRFRLAGST
jgi:protein TonB